MSELIKSAPRPRNFRRFILRSDFLFGTTGLPEQSQHVVALNLVLYKATIAKLLELHGPKLSHDWESFTEVLATVADPVKFQSCRLF